MLEWLRQLRDGAGAVFTTIPIFCIAHGFMAAERIRFIPLPVLPSLVR
jgi:hypothetical protein